MRKALISALVLAVALGAGGLALIAGAGGPVLAATTHAGKIAPPAFSDIAGHPAEAALTLLAGLGAYTGESGLGGPVNPDDPINRAQFCKVVVMAMGWGGTATALAGLRPTFSDMIPIWAWGYVNVAVYRGVINGYADGTFGPGNRVNYAEAVTMLVRAVSGHDRQAQLGVGGWPYNYMFYGVDNGFTGDVDAGFVILPATRGDLARMMAATMQINKVNKDGQPVAATAILAGRVFEGVFKAYGDGFIRVGTTDVPLADLVYIVGGVNYEGLRNLRVRAVTNGAGDCFFVEVLEDSRLVGGVFDQLGDTDGDHRHDCLVFADGTKVPYEEETDGHDDVVDTTINQDVDLHERDLLKGDECLVTLGDDGLAVYVSALRFEVADWIEDFEAAHPSASPAEDTWLHLHGLGDLTVPGTCQVTINGARAGRDDLKIYDCVYVALEGEFDALAVTSAAESPSASSATPLTTPPPGPIAIRAVRQAVQGTVYNTSITYPNEVRRVTIDRTGGGRQTYVFSSAGGATFPSQGDTVKYGLDKDNAIFVPIGYTTLTPYVVVKAYTVDGAGRRTATFDLRGAEVTYRLGPDPDHPTIDLHDAAEEEAYGGIKVNPATGVVTEWTPREVGGYCEVLAVDAVRGTMTLRYWPEGEPDDHYDFIDDPSAVVYKVETSGAKTYVGIAGLHAGDWLQADEMPGGLVFEVTEEPD